MPRSVALSVPWVVRVPHPIDEVLRQAGGAGAKLRTIPIRLLFDDPDLNLRANYTMFDRNTGRPLCVGNGETCRRVTAEGMQTLPCPAPEACELGQGGYCKPYGRMNVRIGEDDELGSFVFRTTGFNSIRTLSARLKYFHAVSGGLLSTLPLELRLRGKSTTQSHRSAIYYVDITVKTGTGLTAAITSARSVKDARQAAGFDQAALDDAARQGLAQGAFEESEEEGASVVEEFYPQSDDAVEEHDSGGLAMVPMPRSPRTNVKPRLADKLEGKAALLIAQGGRSSPQPGG